MKFEAHLTHVTGYLRSGKLVGELTKEEYEEWALLKPADQQDFLQDVGQILITDYRIEGIGDYYNIQWTNDEAI